MTTTPYHKLEAMMTWYTEVLGSELKPEQLRKCLQLVSAEEVNQLFTVKTKTGVKVIYTAIQKDQIDVSTSLLDFITEMEKHEQLLTINVHGASLLHLAAYFGSNEAVMHICKSVSAEYRFMLLAHQAANGETALHYAAADGNTELLTIILDSVEPAQQIKLLDITDNFRQTAFDVALKNSHPSTADRIKQYRLTDNNQGLITPGET